MLQGNFQGLEEGPTREPESNEQRNKGAENGSQGQGAARARRHRPTQPGEKLRGQYQASVVAEVIR